MVNIQRKRDVTVIEFGREYDSLDESNLGKTAQQLIEVAKHADPPLVVFDLSCTRFFGSYFIQFLIRTWKLVKKRNGRLVLAGLDDPCLGVLRRSKIDSLWERFPSVDAAVTDLVGESS
ncbi:STAS domain-containing protein [Blastopirellula sp. JC732]|uniref:STAS domain-containing protein n=1 Tax=Blastopirellula sediminis TaxID=2894196 RepID=A0A9X1SLG8_9BACT|nr:STAS domain-containing protein [Blastopirellula sediminis]MCC9605997.1 STAS domain-containing protein [Blastopirellula sediminis]MCC9630704.1 STAS domain-containing protein [Blastopirellula sediminis]